MSGQGKDSKSAMTEALTEKDDGIFHSLKEGVKDAVEAVTGDDNQQHKARVWSCSCMKETLLSFILIISKNASQNTFSCGVYCLLIVLR